MRIIYVEDNIASVGILARICSRSGDHFTHYPNAEAALAQIDPDSADLILTDVFLSQHGMDGLELAATLRQHGVRTPIIALTAYDSFVLGDRYEKSGCNCWIRKPLDVRALKHLIETYRPAPAAVR